MNPVNEKCISTLIPSAVLLSLFSGGCGVCVFSLFPLQKPLCMRQVPRDHQPLMVAAAQGHPEPFKHGAGTSCIPACECPVTDSGTVTNAARQKRTAAAGHPALMGLGDVSAQSLTLTALRYI